MYEESTSCVQVGHIARISDIGIRTVFSCPRGLSAVL